MREYSVQYLHACTISKQPSSISANFNIHIYSWLRWKLLFVHKCFMIFSYFWKLISINPLFMFIFFISILLSPLSSVKASSCFFSHGFSPRPKVRADVDYSALCSAPCYFSHYKLESYLEIHQFKSEHFICLLRWCLRHCYQATLTSITGNTECVYLCHF